LITFGAFSAEIGGDLSGDNTDMYADIETGVGPKIGPIDVYKVHHHCSSHSTNEAWLKDTAPTVGIISTGDNNDYGHPTADCLDRLHQAGVKTYWTEHGNGLAPVAGLDDVAGNIVVDLAPGATKYSVSSGTQQLASYPIKAGPTPPPVTTGFAWSKNSSVYHHADCKYVQGISSQNLMTGATPPVGKTLRKNCPCTESIPGRSESFDDGYIAPAKFLFYRHNEGGSSVKFIAATLANQQMILSFTSLLAVIPLKTVALEEHPNPNPDLNFGRVFKTVYRRVR
jgi:hypothetical protein